MKHNRIGKLLAVLTAVSMMLPLFNPAVLAEGKDTTHVCGCRPATAAESAAFEKHATNAKYVLPNKLAIQRINEVRQKDGLEPLPESLGVPAGQEMVNDNAKTKKELGAISKTMDQVYGAGPLPAIVDNSTLPAFPEIGDQGQIGSCAAFAVTYYMATYERAMALGLDAKTNKSNQLSPKYTYNLVNGGRRLDGSSITGDINLLNYAGALTMEEFPYDDNYTAWPTTAQLWRRAYSRETVSGQGGIVASVPDGNDYGIPVGLTALKTALLDGKVLVFASYIFRWNVTKTSDDPDISDPNDDHPGEYIVTGLNSDVSQGHGLTIVGYNDHIWVDVDNDRVKDPDEMGAIKVANSWGTEAWNNNNGFIWMSYEAIKDYRYWPDKAGDHPERHPSVLGDYGQTYWITYSDQTYTPEFTAEVDLTTNDRYQLTVCKGINWCEADEPRSSGHYNKYFYSHNYDTDWRLEGDPLGIALSLDGTTQNHEGTVVLDLTKMSGYYQWKNKGGPLTFSVGIYDSPKAGSHTIHSITFKDEKTGYTFTPAGLDTPYIANNGMRWFSNKYILNPTAEPEPYIPAVAGLPQLTPGAAVNKTLYKGGNAAWRFTPTATGKYRIAQSKPEIKIGVENEARNPLLLTNDPSGTGNIIATLYAGRTYVIDAENPDNGGGDEGTLGSLSPVNFNIKISLVNAATASSASADVSNITTTSANAMSPIFSSGVYSYTLKASGTSTTIAAILTDSDAYATIDGKAGTSKVITLDLDESKLVRVDVFAKDWSKSKTYKILVSRPKSTDATLSTLGISTGTWTLSPVSFYKSTTKYTLTLGETQDGITLSPVTSDNTATIKIDNQTIAGNTKTYPLGNGQHTTASIKVTSQSGKSKTYTVYMTRAKSTNNDLSKLEATYGTWDSTFAPSDIDYTLTLGENQRTTKITATKFFKYASLSPSSRTVSLEQGRHVTVKFTVKPQAGKPAKTYTVLVQRDKSTDASLRGLKASGLKLSPMFNKDILSYTATVSAKTKSVTLSPTVDNKYAKVTYYNAATGLPCSKKIVFAKPGDSFEVEVRVTAQDKTTIKSYRITITRSLV